MRCLYALIEKALRWSLHPKVRSRLITCLGARVGKNTRVDEVFFGNAVAGFANLTLADHVYIGPNCFIDLTGTVSVGARTAIAPSCSFLTHADPGSTWGNSLAKVYPREVAGICIGSDCWIGAGVIILCGVSIGNGSVVAAAAVVTKDVPGNVLVGGNPARVLKSLGPEIPVCQ
jgi:maltose O-acetyltransferase